MTYGFQTRSYFRSAEHRENKRQQKEATEKFLAEPRKEVMAPLLCRCLSWDYPHEISAHRELKSDYDWPTPEERKSRFREFWERPL